MPDGENRKTRDCLIKAGKAIGVAAVAVKVIQQVLQESTDEGVSIELDDGQKIDAYYPICKTCGSSMTRFDGWAWYTCPVCGDKVRIIDGEETWEEDIFATSKKEHYSDYDLADFCHGGDLSDDD